MSVFIGEFRFNAPAAWTLVVWVFVLGGAIGSFLNVVAYRWPLGISLSHPGSRCPACERPIRWYHNVPILGWLVLRGRCADCGAAISPRYPTVELIAALASAAVAWSAIVPQEVRDGTQFFSTDLVLIGCQLALVWTLLCAALLEFDGNRPPLTLLLVVLVIGVVVPLADNEVRPLITGGADRPGAIAAAMGAATALLFSALAWPLLVDAASRETIRGAILRAAELVLVGVFLGAKAVAAIAVVTTAMFFVTRLAALRWSPAARFGWAAALLAATLVWIVARGPRVADRWWWSELPEGRELLLAAGAIVALLAIAGRIVRRIPRATSPQRTR